MKLGRLIVPVAIAGALVMTGCTSGSDEEPTITKSASGDDCAKAGDASNSIEITGTIGDDAELTSEVPLTVEGIERTVIKEGKGDVVKEDQTVDVALSMFNGRSGEVIQAQPSSPVPFTAGSLSNWAEEGIRCMNLNQQVALVVPYAEVFGETAAAETGVEGLEDGDSVVVLMQADNIAATTESAEPDGPPEGMLSKAEGTAQEAPAGFPTVTLADDGEPTITMPAGVDAPTSLEIATLIKGDGDVVEPGDTVWVNYKGVIWRTGEEFDSSWSRGEPTSFSTTGVIGGFQEALEGQTVGSQVISVVPAEDGGYGAEALEQQGHEPDDVMVFVLDILAIS